MNNFHTNDHLYIDQITLIVKNAAVSIKFYEEALGFNLKNQKDNVYTLGTSKRDLIKLIENVDALPKERTTGLYHFALLLPNRQYLGQLTNHFLKTNQKLIGGSDHGVSEALYLSDPDGNGIEIYTDRESFLWEYNREGEVIMFTEMMDYEGVMSNAYKEPWTKLPEDTVMGHVHFHVNNLDLGKTYFIDILGFQQTLNYGGSAIFISDQKYHHHVGFNIWNGIEAESRPFDMVGLQSFHLNVPSDQINDLLKRLDDRKIKVREDENGRFIYDLNDVRVYF